MTAWDRHKYTLAVGGLIAVSPAVLGLGGFLLGVGIIGATVLSCWEQRGKE